MSNLHSSTFFVGYHSGDLSTITEMINSQNTQCRYFKIRRESLSSVESALLKESTENESIYQ